MNRTRMLNRAAALLALAGAAALAHAQTEAAPAPAAAPATAAPAVAPTAAAPDQPGAKPALEPGVTPAPVAKAKPVAKPKPGAKPKPDTMPSPQPARKDIVLDAAPAATQAPEAARTHAGAAQAIAAHDLDTSGALAELGLGLLRQRSAGSGDAQANAVVSPFSLASALGMLHAGTEGAGARELALLLGSQGARLYTTRLPDLSGRIAAPGKDGLPFVMANRVWIDAGVVGAVPRSYSAAVARRYKADGALVTFAKANEARAAINGWVARQTANRIEELMPEGSVGPNTKVVLTNAIHFKSPWEDQFDPAKTVAKPFHLAGGAPKDVPTMVDEREVLMGTVDNVSIMQLPFAGNAFALLVGMPPQGHTLNAFETDLKGRDFATWSAALKPSRCRLELPKFTIAPAAHPLKASLQALGVNTVFGQNANLGPMLGKSAKGVYLDNVFQSATVIIDEQGGEAAAATGAATTAKSFSMPAPVCALNRPFIFALVHRASGTPIFMGKVADPCLR